MEAEEQDCAASRVGKLGNSKASGVAHHGAPASFGVHPGTQPSTTSCWTGDVGGQDCAASADEAREPRGEGEGVDMMVGLAAAVLAAVSSLVVAAAGFAAASSLLIAAVGLAAVSSSIIAAAGHVAASRVLGAEPQCCDGMSDEVTKGGWCAEGGAEEGAEVVAARAKAIRTAGAPGHVLPRCVRACIFHHHHYN